MSKEGLTLCCLRFVPGDSEIMPGLWDDFFKFPPVVVRDIGMTHLLEALSIVKRKTYTRCSRFVHNAGLMMPGLWDDFLLIINKASNIGMTFIRSLVNYQKKDLRVDIFTFCRDCFPAIKISWDVIKMDHTSHISNFVHLHQILLVFPAEVIQGNTFSSPNQGVTRVHDGLEMKLPVMI